MSTKTLKIFGLLFAFMLLLGAGCAMTDDTAMEGEANINTEEESEGPETDAEAQAEFVSSLEASFNALNADFEALSARVEADSRELSEETMQRWEELKTELETSRQEARTEIKIYARPAPILGLS